MHEKTPLRLKGSQALADAPSAHGRPVAQGTSAGADAPRGGGTDCGSSVRADLREEDGLPGGVGDSDGGMGIPVERRPPRPNHRPEPRTTDAKSPLPRLPHNGRHRIGQGSLREKALDNIRAIRALKKIEAENRDATYAEQAVLARYTGWGALANAFRPYPPQEWQSVAAGQLRER